MRKIPNQHKYLKNHFQRSPTYPQLLLGGNNKYKGGRTSTNRWIKCSLSLKCLSVGLRKRKKEFLLIKITILIQDRNEKQLPQERTSESLIMGRKVSKQATTTLKTIIIRFLSIKTFNLPVLLKIWSLRSIEKPTTLRITLPSIHFLKKNWMTRSSWILMP